MNKTMIKTVIVTLIVVATLYMLFYLGVKEYQEVYNQGVQDGVTTLYVEMAEILGRCEAYPFPLNNQTFSLIIAECLYQGES